MDARKRAALEDVEDGTKEGMTVEEEIIIGEEIMIPIPDPISEEFREIETQDLLQVVQEGFQEVVAQDLLLEEIRKVLQEPKSTVPVQL